MYNIKNSKMKIFIGREKEFKDCLYINDNCESYINCEGPQFSKGIPEYENVETAIPEELWNSLVEASNNRFTKETYSDYLKVVDFLMHDEKAEEFEEKIRKEEFEYLHEEYGITEDEYDNIKLDDYFDRNIVLTSYENYDQIGEREVEETISHLPDWLTRHIDYYAIGEEMIGGGYYYELSNGRILQLS